MTPELQALCLHPGLIFLSPTLVLAPPRHLAQSGVIWYSSSSSLHAKSFSELSPSSPLLGADFSVPRASAEACPSLLRLCLFPGLGLGEDLGNFPASSGPSPHQDSTWHTAPSTWCGQREEESPFPWPLSRGFSFPALWPPLPWNSGTFPVGFQFLACEDPLEIRIWGLRMKKSNWTAADMGIRERKGRGRPLQSPSCLQRLLVFDRGVRPIYHLRRVPLLLRGSTVFCGDRSQRICHCEPWWCEQNSACLTSAK